MKTSPINTLKNQINSNLGEKNANSNVYSFPNFTGTTLPSFSSTTTLPENDNAKNHHQFSEQDYTINLDWLQFIVTPTIDDYSFDQYNSSIMQIERVRTHKNTNFYHCHKVVYEGREAMEIYSNSVNHTHKRNEFCLKVSNHLLYQSYCMDVVHHLLDTLELGYLRLSKIAIALDGKPNQKVLGYLNRYLKTKTIQINNDNLGITPLSFRKQELIWDGISIGKKRSQKQARVYNKCNELKTNPKHYIYQFWELNGVDFSGNNIIRFELELGYKHLKKYNIKNIDDLFAVEYLVNMLQEETVDWLKFYKVKLNDIKTMRKDKAIMKGKEINYIKWNRLPTKTITLDLVKHLPDERINAKKSVTFSLEQIRKNPTSSSTINHTNNIITVSGDFELQSYVLNKINEKFPYIHLDENHPVSVIRAEMRKVRDGG